MKGRDLINEINDLDPKADVYIDIGGAAGPYLKVMTVHYYPNGVRGRPSLILQAHPTATMVEQKKMMVATLQPSIESAKWALNQLIAISADDQQQIELLRPSRSRKPAKVIELDPTKKK